ncbi:MAG: NADH-quinone oxidoreductase subunit NuoH [Anaerolineae bacterium]
MSFNLGDFLISLIKFTVFDYLRGVWGDQPWVEPVLDVIGAMVLATFCLLIVLVLIWLERKLIARIQDRIGPNRVGGKYGLLQSLADALKLLTKELITPAGADRWAYNLAPFLIVMTSLLMWAVLPFAPGVVGVDLNIGIFFVMAVSSVSVVTLLLAGWGSNNKYALLGAFRSVAQLVSYEVPMILALLIPILLARSMSTVDIIAAQDLPFLIFVPLSALIFFISALAETGRTPFDLLEAESEIVAGFHVEYSGMKFAMFFLAEFLGTFFMSAFFSVIYLGGWNIPIINAILGIFNVHVDLATLAFGRPLGILIFFFKTFAVYSVFVWIRGTLPRVRIDQMLNFNWKFLVPLSLALILMVAVLDKVMDLYFDPSFLTRAGVHLLSNILLGYAALELARWYARRQRLAEEGEENLEIEAPVAEAAPAH